MWCRGCCDEIIYGNIFCTMNFVRVIGGYIRTMRLCSSGNGYVPTIYILDLKYWLSHVLIVFTISLPCLGVPIILSIVRLELEKVKERKYNAVPQRHCLQQLSVLSHIVHFIF